MVQPVHNESVTHKDTAQLQCYKNDNDTSNLK